MRKAKTSATPVIISTIQSIHLQLRYCVTNPPSTGPKTVTKSLASKANNMRGLVSYISNIPGPFIGPILQMEITNARCSSSTKSATKPGPAETRTLPKKAPRNRTIISSGIDVLRAHGIIKTMKRKMHVRHTGFRPYISVRGANTMEPNAKPKR